ncbi:MAG: cation-translocating P-type ATPase [Sandaracinaceae bacterium]|nr:cation-translocating P-type ATPase [Sandaracinaceae bacterium]
MQRAPDPSNHLQLRIDGMSCPACVRRIERAVSRIEGVVQAEVDLASERAWVVISEKAPRARVQAAIEHAIEGVGYRVLHEERHQLGGKNGWEVVVAWICLALTYFIGRVGWSRLEWFMAVFVVVVVGRRTIERGVKQIASFDLSLDALVTMGVLASLVVAFMGESTHHHSHSEALMASLLVVVLRTGKEIEARAKARASEAVEALFRSMPRLARVQKDGEWVEVPAPSVKRGEKVKVGPFEHVPVDGILLGDEPVELDESLITGESKPVLKHPQALVKAGSLALGKSFVLQAEAVGAESELGRLLQLLLQAQQGRLPSIESVDRVVRWVIPLVLTSSFVVAIAWMLGGASLKQSVRIAASMWVVACPCAVGIAAPIAVATAIGELAKKGAFVRRATALEEVARAKTLVFDKTGTVTCGAPKLKKILMAQGALLGEDEIIKLSAAIESVSPHPIGRAIFEEAMRRKLVVPPASMVEEQVGKGVSGIVEGVMVKVRRPDHQCDELFAIEQAPETEPLSVAEVEVDGRVQARMYFEDFLRDSAKDSVKALRKMGFHLAIRSGDDARVVQRIAEELDIKDAIGGLHPQEKIRGDEGWLRPVVMVGDGANDAIAMGRAEVGMALGARMELTLRAADIVLERPDLGLVVEVIQMARSLLRIIRQNLVAAFAYNVVAIFAAAFGVFEAIGGPAGAALAMSASSIAVVLNSLRLKKLSLKVRPQKKSIALSQKDA